MNKHTLTALGASSIAMLASAGAPFGFRHRPGFLFAPDGVGGAGGDGGGDDGETQDLSSIIGDAFDEVMGNDQGADDGTAQQADAPAKPPETATPPAADANAAPQPAAGLSAQEQAAFDALPAETKALVEKRVAAVEAAVKDKVTLADEVNAIVDADFARTLQNSGMSVGQGVAYLAKLERFARTKPADYLAFVADHVKGMGVDVAKVLGLAGQPAAQGDGDEAFADPKVASLEERLTRYERQQAEQTTARVLDDASRQIAEVRDAKDAEGKPLRPHFAAVETEMAALLSANPRMSIAEAYDAAVWSNPTVRAELQKADREAALQAQRDEANAARRAARANVRGGGRSMESSPDIRTTDDAVNAAMDKLGI